MAKQDDLEDNLALKYKGQWSVSMPDKVVIEDDYALIAKVTLF